MAFVHDQSCECAKLELDVFSVPPTQTSVEYSNYVEYHPLSSITDSEPIEFDVSSSGQNYLDFSNTQLLVKGKLTRGNGVDITDADHVGGVDLFLHSLFQQMDVSLNDVQVSQSSRTYAYRAYNESLLSYGPQAKKTQFTAALFYKNTAGNMDRPKPAHANEDERNFGLQKRASFTDEGATVDLIGRIHSDVFFQDRFMLNEINVKDRLVRNKDSFCLMSGESNAFYKVKISSAVLLVRKVQLSPSVFLAHAKALESLLAKYPIRRVVCKTYTIPAGKLNGNHENLFIEQLPTRLVIGCVENDAFNGSYAKNPYNFKNFALSEISIHLDGNTQPIRPLKPNYAGRQYIQAFISLFSGTGKEKKERRNDITHEDYPRVYALFAFDLSPDLAEEEHFNLSKQGTVRVELKFGTALPNIVTVVAYAKFENVIEIDRNRNVIYDFGS